MQLQCYLTLRLDRASGEEVWFRLDDFEGEIRARSAYARQPYALRDAWCRYRTFDRASFDRLLAKHAPGAVELQPVLSDRRLEINRLIDLPAEVWEISLYDSSDGQKKYPSAHSLKRRNEDEEEINADGIPEREINCITGEPYPRPPEGQQRYKVAIMFKQGGSFSDAHEFWMATEPREAALAALQTCKEEMAQNPMLGMFMQGGAGNIMVTDFDTEKTYFFSGDDAVKDANAEAHDTMFSLMRRSFLGGVLDDGSDE